MKWRAAVDRAVADLGLTHAQYSLLASLFGMERAGHTPSQRELADHTGLEAIYVSKLARALEASGLITRVGDNADTRAVRLSLTETGRDIVRRAIRTVHELLEHLTEPLGGLGGARTRTLARELRALLAVDQPSRTKPTTTETPTTNPTTTKQGAHQ